MQHNTTITDINPLEQRSIWMSIKQIFGASADAITHTTHAVSTVALVGDTLAGTGLVMAESNNRMVCLEVKGKEQRRLFELYIEFPELDPEYKPAKSATVKK